MVLLLLSLKMGACYQAELEPDLFMPCLTDAVDRGSGLFFR